MKKFYLLFACLVSITIASAQNFMTKNGKISFYSKATLENIEAVNNQVVSVFFSVKNEIAFSVIIKGFLFKKGLMQEHFNEDYMESDKYPKASFKGTIADISKLNLKSDGIYPVKVNGKLTMHGVTRNIETKAVFTVKSGKVNATTEFNILLADYKISIPKVVENNISPTIKISVDCNYEPRI